MRATNQGWVFHTTCNRQKRAVLYHTRGGGAAQYVLCGGRGDGSELCTAEFIMILRIKYPLYRLTGESINHGVLEELLVPARR